MNNNDINQSNRLRRINSATGAACQDKSVDRIGPLLDLIIDGLLEPDAPRAAQEEGGQALINLVGYHAWKRVWEYLRSERPDIEGDVVLGAIRALNRIQKALPALTKRCPSRAAKRGYVFGIIYRQCSSAIRNATRTVSRQMRIAWQPEDDGFRNARAVVDPLDLVAAISFEQRARCITPTSNELQTLVYQAADRGFGIRAALYEAMRDYCEDIEEPAPILGAAPSVKSKRTLQRRERDGAEFIENSLKGSNGSIGGHSYHPIGGPSME